MTWTYDLYSTTLLGHRDSGSLARGSRSMLIEMHIYGMYLRRYVVQTTSCL